MKAQKKWIGEERSIEYERDEAIVEQRRSPNFASKSQNSLIREPLK